jgi:hypothetical protein
MSHAHPSPVFATRLNAERLLCLLPACCLPAAGACFSEDAALLLLVCSGGWALLQAEGWDGRDAPAYTRLLHITPEGTHQSDPGAGNGAGAAPRERHVSWQESGGEGPLAGPVEADLAGGVILSGAMAADRTRGDHYYAGA